MASGFGADSIEGRTVDVGSASTTARTCPIKRRTSDHVRIPSELIRFILGEDRRRPALPSSTLREQFDCFSNASFTSLDALRAIDVVDVEWLSAVRQRAKERAR